MVTLAASQNLSFSDRIMAFLERVDYRLVETLEDREAVYRMRYDAYLREGAIEPNPFNHKFSDAFDDTVNAWTFAVYVERRLAGSLRVHVATAQQPIMPALTPFPDFLQPELNDGRIIIDPTRFVADNECSRAHPELRYVTVRLAWAASEHFNADLLLATVRGEHQAFYKRTFGHREICPPRPYPTLKKPLSLMALHYPAERDLVLQRYPFFHTTAFERRMLFGRGDGGAREVAAA